MNYEERHAKFLEDYLRTGEEPTERYTQLGAIVNELSKNEHNLKTLFDK